jgi:hypothetical protein
MKIAVTLVAVLSTGLVFAKLSPLSEEAQAKAAEAAAKSAWSDKVGLYKTCLAMDRTAEAYRKSLKEAGKDAPTPASASSCVDPGPYVPVTAANPKPMEASGAHSPPETATTPPSSQTPQAHK